MNTREIGQAAESCALQFLLNQGLTLVKRNFSCQMGEIDLIMQDKNDIVFVEVRKRTSIDFGNPIETINKIKIRKIIKAATLFLQSKDWLNRVNSRFDVLGIHAKSAGKHEMRWIKNAFTIDE